MDNKDGGGDFARIRFSFARALTQLVWNSRLRPLLDDARHAVAASARL